MCELNNVAAYKKVIAMQTISWNVPEDSVRSHIPTKYSIRFGFTQWFIVYFDGTPFFRVSSTLMTIRSKPSVSNWEWDNGYLGQSNENEYPVRVANSGPSSGLEVSLLAHKQDHTSLCTQSDEDFVVNLSTPGETSQVNQFDFEVPISTNSLLSIEPKLTITSDVLSSFTPKQRGCFYDVERRLTYFKFYSANNCVMECLSNYTAMQCGCVLFNMPRMYL